MELGPFSVASGLLDTWRMMRMERGAQDLASPSGNSKRGRKSLGLGDGIVGQNECYLAATLRGLYQRFRLHSPRPSFKLNL
jgi:hypothetical protein